jgi:hypothetical protein
MHDLTRLVADGKCDRSAANGIAWAEIRYEGELRGLALLPAVERIPACLAFADLLFVADTYGRRASFLAAELMAEIGERMLESAAPVGHAPRREEGGEGSRFGGDGETVDEGSAGSQGEEEA